MPLSTALQRRLIALVLSSIQVVILLWAAHAAQKKFHYASHAYGGFGNEKYSNSDSAGTGEAWGVLPMSPPCAGSVAEVKSISDMRRICGTTPLTKQEQTSDNYHEIEDTTLGKNARRKKVSPNSGAQSKREKESERAIPQFKRVLWLMVDSMPLDWARGQAPEELFDSLQGDSEDTGKRTRSSTSATETRADDEDLWSDLLAPMRASSNWFRIMNEGFKFSSALYTSFFTGMLPANYNARQIVHDNIFAQMVQSGQRVHYIGPRFVTLDLLPAARTTYRKKQSSDVAFEKTSPVFEFAEDRGEGHPRTRTLFGAASPHFLFSHLGSSPANPLGYADNQSLGVGASLFSATNQLDSAMHKSGRGDPENYRLARSVSSVFKAAKAFTDDHSDVLLVLMSDHGASAHGGTDEGSLHGDAEGGNCAWVVLYSPVLASAIANRDGGNPASKSHARSLGRTVRLYDGLWIDTVDFAATLSQYFDGVNIPSSSIGKAVPIFDGSDMVSAQTYFQNAQQLSMLAERESLVYDRQAIEAAAEALISNDLDTFVGLRERLAAVVASIKEPLYESKRFPFFWLATLVILILWRVVGLITGLTPPPFTPSALIDALRSWSRMLDVVAIGLSPGIFMFWDLNFLGANYYHSGFSSSHRMFLYFAGAVLIWFATCLARERTRTHFAAASEGSRVAALWHAMGKWRMVASGLWVFMLFNRFASRQSSWSSGFGSWMMDCFLLFLWLGVDAVFEYFANNAATKPRRAGRWGRMRLKAETLLSGPATYVSYFVMVVVFGILGINEHAFSMSLALGLVVLHGLIACVFSPRSLLLSVVFLSVVGTRLGAHGGFRGIPTSHSANSLLILSCAVPFSAVVGPAFVSAVRLYWSHFSTLQPTTDNSSFRQTVARPVVRWLALWYARSLCMLAFAAAAVVFSLGGRDYENFASANNWKVQSLWHGAALTVARDAPFYLFIGLLARLRAFEHDADPDANIEGPSGRQSPTRVFIGVLYVRAFVLLCTFHLSFWLYKEYHTCYGVAMMASTLAAFAGISFSVAEWVRVAVISLDEPEQSLFH